MPVDDPVPAGLHIRRAGAGNSVEPDVPRAYRPPTVSLLAPQAAPETPRSRPHRRARPPGARGRLPDRDARRRRRGRRRRRRRVGLRAARRRPGRTAAAPGRRPRRARLLRPHRHRPTRDLPHRPPARPRRRRRPGRHRLAGADEPAVLPGQRRRTAGPACAAAGSASPAASSPVTRTSCSPAGDEHREPVPAGGDRAAAQRARCATSSPPSSPTRTTSSGPRWPSRSACRARRAPARPRSACTARPTCSTRTAASWPGPACWWSGPNRAFLRYIEEVLPTLGEVDVDQTTVAGLTARVPVRAVDPPEVAVLKGDAADGRGAAPGAVGRDRASRRTRSRCRWPAASTGCRVERLKRYVDDLRRRAPRRRRPAAAALRRRPGAAGDAASRRTPAGRRRRPAAAPPTPRPARPPAAPRCAAFCDAVWPARDAAGAGAATSGPTPPGWPAPPAACSTDEEQALLRWPTAPRSVRTAPWTEADAVLVDEVAGLLERTPGYGHVVVDEAQDLSPMQCRAVARRLAAGSLTVLGDLAQATSPWSPSDWQQTLAGLGRPDTVVRPLTRGYRVPGRGPRLRQPAAAADRARPAGGHRGPLRAGALRAAAGDARSPSRWSRWSPSCGPRPGSIGVVCADAAVAGGRRAARGAPGLDGGGADRRRRGAPAAVAVVPATLAKGLEFDASWWSTRPRSWPPSRAVCTGSTSSSPAR